MKVTFFWGQTQRWLLICYRIFGGAGLHLRGTRRRQIIPATYYSPTTLKMERSQQTTNQRGFTPKKTETVLQPDCTHFPKLILCIYIVWRCSPAQLFAESASPKWRHISLHSCQLSGCHEHERDTSTTNYFFAEK